MELGSAAGIRAEPKVGKQNCFPTTNPKEAIMPLILLWVGIPVLLLGGGYAIVHVMH
jgi:hypothetical protein